MVFTLTSATTGASISYRLKSDSQRGWKVYDRPVVVKRGETLAAKACRIGFRDSELVEFTTQSRPSAIVEVAQQNGEDWRATVISEMTLPKLLALKEHDRDPAGGIEVYRRALSDPHPAMRYWAIVGLRVATGNLAPADADTAALAKLSESDGWMVVRIAAAHALCRWGELEKGMPVLTAALDSPQASIQLHAAHALEDLGEHARPLLPKLKQLAASSSEYVERVTRRAVERLNSRDR
jgi:hypothetical protein